MLADKGARLRSTRKADNRVTARIERFALRPIGLAALTPALSDQG
jgi:hypothetical protein